MYVLALDTASEYLLCGLAELTDDKITLIDSEDKPAPRRSNQTLMPSAQKLLERNKISIDDISAVICGRGPGSFTGVRIAVASAKGLAYAQNIPLYGASSLDALAYTNYLKGFRGELILVGDAMRKEIYPAHYSLYDRGVTKRFSSHGVIKADKLIEHFKQIDLSELYFAGDGLKKYAQGFLEIGAQLLDECYWYPSSEGLVHAACASQDEHESADPALLLPIYTRLSDAEEHERIKLGLKQDSQAIKTGVADKLAGEHLQFRPMSINDIKQIYSLEQDGFDDLREIWSEDMFAEEFSHTDRIWWLAHDKGKIIAFAGAQYIDGDVQILDIVVDKHYRRQGIAKRLLARVSYDASQLGATTASLEVHEKNYPAQELYLSLGFEKIGERKHYYGQDVSALILRAELPLKLDIATKTPEPRQPKRAYPLEHKELSQDELARIEQDRPLILSIESSCDETAMAIINKEGKVLANIVASQIDFHARFGGVVPEIASRKHTEALVGVYETCLEECAQTLGVSQMSIAHLDAVAVTQGPGLVGALVVGMAFAKGLVFGSPLKLIGVNHLEGHLYANLFETPDLKPPFIASIVSGGHTMLVYVKDWGNYEVLGQTLDDAVGEAFDKVSKALGLGYPGGPIISKFAEKGNPEAIDFPRAMLHSHSYEFSLSGLKTAVVNYIHQENQAGRPINIPDLAASFQAAVVDVQVAKAKHAVEETGVKDICVGGGVAANKSLRAAYEKTFEKMDVRTTFPPLVACTDNAAMIGLVALTHYNNAQFIDLSADADPNLSL